MIVVRTVLAAAIAVENASLRRRPKGDAHLQGPDCKIVLHAVADGPANIAPRVQIEDQGLIQQALATPISPDTAHASDPLLHVTWSKERHQTATGSVSTSKSPKRPPATRVGLSHLPLFIVFPGRHHCPWTGKPLTSWLVSKRLVCHAIRFPGGSQAIRSALRANIPSGLIDPRFTALCDGRTPSPCSFSGKASILPTYRCHAYTGDVT